MIILMIIRWIYHRTLHSASHNICLYVSLVEEDIIICLSYMSYPRSAADHTFFTRSCKRIITNLREKTLIFSHN